MKGSCQFCWELRCPFNGNKVALLLISADAAKCGTGLDNVAIPFLLGNLALLGQHGGMAFGRVGFVHCGHQGCCHMGRRKAES